MEGSVGIRYKTGMALWRVTRKDSEGKQHLNGGLETNEEKSHLRSLLHWGDFAYVKVVAVDITTIILIV